jgi:tetratricopeptide (TPR) repeat protein
LYLASKQSYPAYREALALIDTNLQKDNSIEDRRVKALVMATQPAQRAEAIRMFESLSPLSSSTPAVMQIILARLYDADGRWPQARACLQALAIGEDRPQQQIRDAVRLLLRHKELEDAQRLFDLLDGAGTDQNPDTIEVRVRLLHAEGKRAEALAILDKYRGDKEERLAPAALLLQLLGESEAAEKLLRRLAGNPKRPEGLLLLARHLAVCKRLGEALQVCDRAWGRARDEEVATVSLRVLRTAGSATAEQRAKVAEKVRAALMRKSDSVGLLLTLADLEDMAGRYDEAINLYRRVLEIQPDNLPALNNLSYLLALKEGKHDHALKLVDAVLAAAGPLGEVLDTRGLIYLQSGRSDKAVADLLAALRQDPGGPKYFHLAQAQHAAGERLAARAALARARAKGLKEEGLHPLERPGFRSLVSELENR